MANINPNDGINRINNVIKKENKLNKEKKVVAETKQVEASALNALSSYGKANISFRANSNTTFEQQKVDLEKRLKEAKIHESDIRGILRHVKEETLPLAEKLCFIKDKYGEPLFYNKKLIANILKEVKPETLSFAENLCVDNSFIDKHLIPDVLKHTTTNNLELAQKLCLGKNEFGSELLYDKYIVDEILRHTANGSKKIINFAEKLCIGKDEKSGILFPQDNLICSILYSLNEDNLPLAEKLCFAKDENGKDLFKDKSIISTLLFNTNKENLEIAEEFCFNKKYKIKGEPEESFSSVIYYTSENNFELAKKLLEERNYSFSDIVKILQETKKANLILENDKIYVDKKKETSYTLKEFSDFILDIKDNEDLIKGEKETLIQAFIQIQPKNLKGKTYALYILKKIIADKILTEEQRKTLNLEKQIEKIENSIKQVIIPTQTTPEAIQRMMKGFFANNNTNLDKLLVESPFEDYGKNGLPLKYSRESFLNDLTNIFKNLSKNEKRNIENKLNISIIEEEEKITGYNGIINLTALSKDGKEGEILALATKFIKENEITTGNKNLDETLNSLIKGMPEFINVIGKQQHGTQDFSVDIHMLTVLKSALNNPKYKELSDANKFALKMATILHDIGKEEGIVDEGHASISALYVKDILNKDGLNINTELKNRIYELVRNHHWLADYNKGDKTADYTAALFRRTEDLDVAQIMAEADLKGVTKDDWFYECYKDALSKEMQTPIKDSINNINSMGQMFFTNKIINPKKLPIVEYNGKEYKVINFTELPKNTDLEQFGFEPNTTVENMRLFVHTTDNMADIDNVKHLSDSSNEGFLCASYISIENNQTYLNNQFGVSIEAEQANIANATKENQHSGYEKTFDKFSEFITTNENREIIPTYIKKELGLSDNEYAKLFELIQNKRYLSQLDNIKEIKIYDKTFTGKEIKDVIKKANDEIISKEERHNEANLYSPKINAIVAKVDKLSEIPTVLLDFAEKNDYPIYLIGE